MAYGEGSPQLEDGFARIANEILDALALTSLSDIESRCIHFLWRKTYGWQDGKGESKKEDIIAYSQWATGTSIDKRTVRRALQNLTDRHILTKKTIKRPGKNPLTIWGFQKYYNKWNGYHPVYQLQLGTPQPPLDSNVGAIEPPLNKEVGATQPPVSFKVGANTDKVGAPQPPEVGAPQPPTIDNKDTTTIDSSSNKGKEAEILKVLESLKGWNSDHDSDLLWLRGLIKDYPCVDVLKVKACGDYHSDKPVKKGPWKNRLRQWLQHDADYSKRLKKEGTTNGEYHPPKSPPGFTAPVKYIETGNEED